MQFQDIRTSELVKKRFEWASKIHRKIPGSPRGKNRLHIAA